MALLIRHGEIINADSRTHADVLVEGETITRIGKNLEAPAGATVIVSVPVPMTEGFALAAIVTVEVTGLTVWLTEPEVLGRRFTSPA